MTLAALGDSAIVLAWGDTVDDGSVARAVAVAAALARANLPGVVDAVPAFASVTIYFDLDRIGPMEAFEAALRNIAGQFAAAPAPTIPPRTIEVPVCFGGEFGPDLATVARRAKRPIEEVIALFTSAAYHVHAIGFLPGFGYLAGLHTVLETPRQPTPRPCVPAGSVGIGGAQAGIYPLACPGGWNLLGRTPLTLFDASRAEPSLLRVGDRVAFRTIAAPEFASWK